MFILKVGCITTVILSLLFVLIMLAAYSHIKFIIKFLLCIIFFALDFISAVGCYFLPLPDNSIIGIASIVLCIAFICLSKAFVEENNKN